MANSVHLSWGEVGGAISFNIYHDTQPGLSIHRTPLLINVEALEYTHSGLTPETTHYYIIVAVGPNGELSPPSQEIGLTVGVEVLTSIVVTPTNFSLHTPLQQQYTAIGHYSDLSTQDITNTVTWDTSNHAKATISSSGLLTAVADGTANVTATLGLVTGSTLVTVIGVSALYLCADNASGLTQPLTAEALFTDSTTLDVTSIGTWQTTNGSAATVDAYGLATLTGVGSANISVTYQSISKSLNFNVVVPSSTWQEELTSSLPFSHIQGFDDTHIWAVPGFFGGSTTIYYSTGNGTWSTQSLPTNLSCNQIYVASTTVVYLANNIGPNVLLKTTNGGSLWTASSITFSGLTVDYMSGLYGVGVNTLWAIVGVNENANIYIIKSTDGGSNWSQDHIMSAYGNHIWANSLSDVWTTDYDGNYYRWNGSSWSTGVIDAGQGFDGIWGTGPNNMYFGGFSLSASPSKIYHWNGSSFTSQSTTPSLVSTNDWWTISGNSAGTDIWAADFNYSTSNALIWRSEDGVTWSSSDTPPIHTTEQFVAVWRATDKIYIGSQDGTILSLELNPNSLIVSPKLIKDITIIPNPTATVSVGHPTTFSALANFSDSTDGYLTTEVTWLSSNASAATIDAYGVATAVTQGQNTNISLTATNFFCHYPSATVLSCIAPPALVSINIAFVSQPTSTTRQYSATGTYSDSSTLDLTSTASWNSTVPSVGTISGSGLFTYVGPGSTDITATHSSVTSNMITISLTNMWGSEANPAATMLGGFALSSNNLFINNSYNAPSFILKSTGNGTWTNTDMGLGGSSPGNNFPVWGTGTLLLVGGQASSTSNAIIRSTDSGSAWATVSNSFASAVWWIHGSSTSNIWASGGTNSLIKSVDSGATWSNVSFSAGFTEGIFAISSTDVWVGGANSAFTSGMLQHYNGSTFTNFYSNLGNSDVIVTSIWASSSSDIYVAGISVANSNIKYVYHSTNSGSTFTLERKVFDATGSDKVRVFGIDSSNVYFGVNAVQLLFTTGNGTWTREVVELPYGSQAINNPNISALLGYDSSHVWAAGSTGTTFIIKKNKILDLTPLLVSIEVTGPTSISGTAQYTAMGTYNDGREINLTSDVVWSSTNTGVATISNTMATIGIATNVGVGSTNITATLGSVSGFLTISGSAAWAVFYDKANQPTSPATGYSHVPATGGNIANYTGLAKIGSTIVASNGLMSWYSTAASVDGKYPFLTTTNNGSTFQVAAWPLATDSNQALDGNSFYAPNIYATTDKFLVGCERNKTSNLTTSTDGLTWSTSVQLPPNSRAVAAFHSTSNSNIWAVSDTPTGSIYVWQSIDDGASWTAISSPISSGGSTYFPSVFTISSTDVWVAGATNGVNANPCVYHYNGSTWTDCSAALRTAKGGNFNALIIGIWASDTNNVYFIDANFGHNQLYRTTNQGTSFTVIDVDPSNSRIFNSIAGTSSSNIYLAGYSGNIYHYNGSAWAKETLPSSPSYIATSDYLGLWIDGSTVYACGQNIIKK